MAYIFIFSGVFPRTEVLHLMKFDLTILDLMFYSFSHVLSTKAAYLKIMDIFCNVFFLKF